MLQCSLVISKSIASLLHDVQRDSFDPLTFNYFKIYYYFTMCKWWCFDSKKIHLTFSLSSFLWFFENQTRPPLLKILSQKVEKALFTNYYSPITVHWLLFIILFTSNFCLFKGGCSLSLTQNSLKLELSLELLFSFRISL